MSCLNIFRILSRVDFADQTPLINILKQVPEGQDSYLLTNKMVSILSAEWQDLANIWSALGFKTFRKVLFQAILAMKTARKTIYIEELSVQQEGATRRIR